MKVLFVFLFFFSGCLMMSVASRATTDGCVAEWQGASISSGPGYPFFHFFAGLTIENGEWRLRSECFSPWSRCGPCNWSVSLPLPQTGSFRIVRFTVGNGLYPYGTVPIMLAYADGKTYLAQGTTFCSFDSVLTCEPPTGWALISDWGLTGECVGGGSGVQGEVSDPSNDGLELSAIPNPFRSGAVLSFHTERAGQVRVVVYNSAGQRIRNLMDVYMQPGTHTVPWDGSDDSGRSVGAGSYYYRVSVDNIEGSKRIVLLR